MHDVIVVGGGPVGSFIAAGLAEKGYDTAILERKPELTGKASCTGIIGQECRRKFLPDDRLILRETGRAVIYSPNGQTVTVSRPQTQAVIIDRKQFDITMARRAQERGARLLLDHTVESVGTEKGRVTVKINNQPDITGRVVVIAGGYNPGLTERCGLGRVADAAAGAQAVVQSDISDVEVFFGQSLAPGFFGWLVPAAPGQARVGLLTRREPNRHLTELLAGLKNNGKINNTDGEIVGGGVPVKPIAKSYGERIIAVGDSAGQVKPTTGGGLYFGLLCAEIAVQTLIEGLEQNRLSARNLSDYEKQWRKLLGREITLGYRARRVYEKLNDSQIDRVFGRIKNSGMDKVLLESQELSFDWHSEALIKLATQFALGKTKQIFKVPFLAR